MLGCYPTGKLWQVIPGNPCEKGPTWTYENSWGNPFYYMLPFIEQDNLFKSVNVFAYPGVPLQGPRGNYNFAAFDRSWSQCRPSSRRPRDILEVFRSKVLKLE